MSAMLNPMQSEFFADKLLVKPSVEAPAIRAADRKTDQLPNRQPLLDKLATLGKLDPLAFASYLIAFFIGVIATLAWQSHGGATREIISPAAPSPDQQQLNAMSVNLDAMRQSVDRIANNMALNQEQMTRSVSQLAAGQEWMTREIADLQTVEQYVLDKISLPPLRPTHAAPRNLVPRSSQAPIPLVPARDR
jgi:hypothetical protein